MWARIQGYILALTVRIMHTKTGVIRTWYLQKSQKELEAKMAKLKNMEQIGANYSKLTEELHPMAYWGGDTNHDVFLTESASE